MNHRETLQAILKSALPCPHCHHAVTGEWRHCTAPKCAKRLAAVALDPEEPCPDCDGHGEYRNGPEVTLYNYLGAGDASYHECERCLGSGDVEKVCPECGEPIGTVPNNGEICDVCLRDWTEREEEQEARDRQTDAAMLQGGLAQDSEADNG